MSVSGISSSSLFDFGLQSMPKRMQQFRQEFQQLGKDLQSGNLSAAQADFASLQELQPKANSASSAQNSNPIAQEFQQLSQDLRSGNLSAAQQDFAGIQQNFQSQARQVHGHHHHHHSGGDSNGISQMLNQLGQALQSGDLSAAQTAYSTLQKEFQQFDQSSGLLTPGSSGSSADGLSVNA
ncbi:MAG TPA: hypothetical protein VEG30_09005 [Terriglobales bacterium]|nr:hypothetical protein [Terriglobales bacterium]